MIAETHFWSPSITSQFTICPIPFHLDTYKGCVHDCAYCFGERSEELLLGGQVGVGQLSPDWTEWLMNWPVGWTDPSLEYAWTCPSESTACTRSATPRCLKQWLQRGRTWLEKLDW